MNLERTAAVVIGRNEGERLRRCLASLAGRLPCVVYVDSGSTDDSVEIAVAAGAVIVALDLRTPFTAARARNEGFRRALLQAPGLEFVQFVDGDCEIDPGWLVASHGFLQSTPAMGAVAGWRRERYPEHSVYNRLCDIEWKVPAGPARSFGGDVMIRSRALVEVGGYRDSLIAGEEPELCVRLRAQGWKIEILPLPMTLHDAGITRFGQWWRRTMRAGFAYAEGAHLHGAPPERHFVRQRNSALVWGAVLPLCPLIVLPWVGPAALLLWGIYPIQFIRLARQNRHDWPSAHWARAYFLILGKLPEALGILRQWWLRASKQRAMLIEYK